MQQLNCSVYEHCLRAVGMSKLLGAWKAARTTRAVACYTTSASQSWQWC